MNSAPSLFHFLPYLLLFGLIVSLIILAVPLLGRKVSLTLSLLSHFMFFAFASTWAVLSSTEPLKLSFGPTKALFNISFYFDGWSSLFFQLIAGIGILISWFSYQYFNDEKKFRRCLGLLQLFALSMFGVVCSDNLLWLFVFWELTTITSYLLISFKGEEEGARQAALQALLVTGLGGLSLLASIILIGQASGTYAISALIANPQSVMDSPHFLVIVVTFLVACMTKSAQFPFHYWLPGAMQAPTPVSAYLHSATMVKAGIFLAARMFPVFSDSALFSFVLIASGLITALWGILCSYRVTDLKQILAFTTVSALGTLMALIGLGSTMAMQAAVVFLIVHALYKSGLFISLGAMESAFGHRDIERMDNLSAKSPILSVALVLLILSMIGVPPMLGFIAKELIYEAQFNAIRYSWLLIVGVFIVNIFTIGTALRIFKTILPLKNIPKNIFSSPIPCLGPVLLATAGLALALLGPWASSLLLTPALSAVLAQTTDFKIALWHGLNVVLLVSIFTLIVGVMAFGQRKRIARIVQAPWLNSFNFVNLHTNILQWVLRFAKAQTRLFFPEGLSGAIYVTLSFAVLALAFALIKSDGWTQSKAILSSFRANDFSLWDIIAIILVYASVVFVFRAKTTIVGVLAAGLAGLGVVVMFSLYSAPDLALTQLLVETFVLVALVLFLAKAELKKVRWSPWRNAMSWIASGVVASLMTLSLLSVVQPDLSERVSAKFAEQSYLQANGKNVVNVILVDFRSMDTFGEVAVLGIAVLGALSLLNLLTARLREEGHE